MVPSSVPHPSSGAPAQLAGGRVPGCGVCPWKLAATGRTHTAASIDGRIGELGRGEDRRPSLPVRAETTRVGLAENFTIDITHEVFTRAMVSWSLRDRKYIAIIPVIYRLGVLPRVRNVEAEVLQGSPFRRAELGHF